MREEPYVWTVKHKLGDKNAFSEYFSRFNFTWKLSLISTDKHLLFLEHFGYLTFDVFTEYTLTIHYVDKEIEEKRVFFAFGGQLDFGVTILPKETKRVEINIISSSRCYEAKKTLPFPGLLNLGSTCYQNTLIQTLFHIKEFVRELFKQPPKKKTLEMQKLFYQLEKEKNYVDTNSFANAFKLSDPIDDQQDIQEFFKVLLDELEKEAKDTPFFNYLDETFYGEKASLLECQFGCKSERIEKYNDIPLAVDVPVQNETFLQASLNLDVNVTHLDTPNLYNCEEHGYVRATKTEYFKTFPPVLFIQIKRFNMNYETGEIYKLNSFFSYPEQIDLSPYTKTQKDTKYKLYAVNVHMGDGLSEGHYYAYIKKNSNWYKFNDCYVTESSEREAVEGTFGGSHEYKNKQKTANAYYLVYIRESQENNLLNSPVEEVPKEIKEKIEREEYLAKYTAISIYTEDTFKGYWGKGFSSSSNYYAKRVPSTLKVENASTINKIKIQGKHLINSPDLIFSLAHNKLLLMEDAAVLGDSLAHQSTAHSTPQATEQSHATAHAVERNGEHDVERIGERNGERSAHFFISSCRGIEREEVFVLFIKTEKASNQPYDLKVLVEVKEVKIIKRKENIHTWIKENYSSTQSTGLTFLGEKDGLPYDIPETDTFEEFFKSNFGIVIINAGKDSVNEYFLQLSNHSIVPVYVTECATEHAEHAAHPPTEHAEHADHPVFLLWIDHTAPHAPSHTAGQSTGQSTEHAASQDVERDVERDTSQDVEHAAEHAVERNAKCDVVRELIQQKIKSSNFTIVGHPSGNAPEHLTEHNEERNGERNGSRNGPRVVHIKLHDAHALVQVSLLYGRKENINLSQNELFLIPERLSGDSLINLTGYKAVSKTRIIRSVYGKEELQYYKVSDTVEVRNGDILSIQEVSNRSSAMALIKYKEDTVGHPFLIEIDSKTGLETKRKYGLDNSVLIRVTHKKQRRVVQDASVVKKNSSSDLFLFLVDFSLQWRIIEDYHRKNYF
ncbi:ubiquitin carboxyl-terminal hydrolase 7 [Nematocida sp. LUAm3]|nr:ubiquitin carboxyl-terminal hydrolase 7 [Nematocida sp. LUAm3]KAI5175990.1 ubiquitin carboxyl-terminal hydrolase 7 [Nematocida sp. LUAm2]KAI5179086.1 ubiquitin carboxyl-terminal hydrolase 7 [Nematocida sp. LUAm1]